MENFISFWIHILLMSTSVDYEMIGPTMERFYGGIYFTTLSGTSLYDSFVFFVYSISDRYHTYISLRDSALSHKKIIPLMALLEQKLIAQSACYLVLKFVP